MAFEDFISSIFGGGGASPAADPNAGGGGGGYMPQSDSGGFDIGKMLMPMLLGGGSMLASKLMGRGEQKNIDKATKNIRGIGNTATGAGTQMVNRAAAGKLTDPQQAGVDRMKSEQNAQWAQRFAQMGIPMSTMATQASNLVETQAQELSNKLINESFQQGIAALNLGSSSSQALLTSASKQKADLAATIGEVAKQIGMVMNQPGRGQGQQGSAQARVPTEWGGANEYGDVGSVGTEEGMGY